MVRLFPFVITKANQILRNSKKIKIQWKQDEHRAAGWINRPLALILVYTRVLVDLNLDLLVQQYHGIHSCSTQNLSVQNFSNIK